MVTSVPVTWASQRPSGEMAGQTFSNAADLISVLKDDPNAARFGGWWPGAMTLVVHTDGTSGVAEAVRRVVAELDPETPVANARGMDDVVGAAMAS